MLNPGVGGSKAVNQAKKEIPRGRTKQSTDGKMLLKEKAHSAFSGYLRINTKFCNVCKVTVTNRVIQRRASLSIEKSSALAAEKD